MQVPGELAAVLAVTELSKVYRGRKPVTAVDHLTFELGRGEILGLLGPNGAGKTTTIQMLLSTLKPTTGRIEYFGRSLALDRESILALVGYASAYSKLPSHLAIEENLDVFGRLYGMPSHARKERTKELLTRFGVWDLRRRTMTGLSAGQTTRVMLAKGVPRSAEGSASGRADGVARPGHRPRGPRLRPRTAGRSRSLDPIYLAQHGRSGRGLRPGALS
jgi:ABC-2 type transport system ATP-binding protein